jgi:HEAT repeat protein
MRVHPSDDTLWKVLDGDAERESAAGLRDHLDDCPSCTDSLDEMRRLDSDLRSFFEGEASRAAATPPPLVDWHEVERRQRHVRSTGGRRLGIGVAALAAAAAVVLAVVLFLARNRDAHVELVRGWLFARVDDDLVFVENGGVVPYLSRVVSLGDTEAEVVVGRDRTELGILGRTEFEVSKDGTSLREGTLSVRSSGRVAAPAFGVVADGSDFVASIEADACRIVARSKDVQVDVAGERRTVIAGKIARVRGGNPPWFVSSSSNVSEEFPTTSLPIALRDAEVGEGAVTHPSGRSSSVVELLADGLQHSTLAAVRRRCVEAIGALPVPELGPIALAVALDPSESPALRAVATEAAGRVRAPGVVEGLVSLIETPQTALEVRVAAARALGRIGPSAAAAEALRRAGSRAATPVAAADAVDLPAIYEGLLADLRSGGDADLSEALAALARQAGSPDDLAAAVRMFERRFRIAAVRLAIVAGGADVDSALIAFLDDPDPAVAAEAALALGLRHERFDAATTPPAARAVARVWSLRTGDAEFRQRATHALALMADPAAVPVLVAALDSSRSSERNSAAFGLGRILGSTGAAIEPALAASAVDALRRALRDEDAGVRRNAVSALTAALRGSPHDAAVAFVPLLDDESSETRRRAAVALRSVPSEEAAEALRHSVENDPDVQVRAACASAYGACARAAGIPVLRGWLAGATDPATVREIVAGLEHTGTGLSPEDFYPLLDSPDPGMRLAAVAALRLVHDGGSSRAETLRRVAALLADATASVRAAALGLVASLTPHNANEIESWLLPALKSADPAIALNSAIALARDGRAEGPEAIARWLAATATPGKPAMERATERVRILGSLLRLGTRLPDEIARAAEELETRGSLDDEATVAALLQLALVFDLPASDALLDAAARSGNPMIRVGAACALARRTRDRATVADALDRTGTPPAVARALTELSPPSDPGERRAWLASEATVRAIEKAFEDWPADSVHHFEPSPGFLRLLPDSPTRQQRTDEIARLVALRHGLIESLASLAADERPAVRAIGAQALGSLSSGTALRIAVAKSADRDASVREAGRQSVIEIAGDDLGIRATSRAEDVIAAAQSLSNRSSEFGDRAEALIARLQQALANDGE